MRLILAAATDIASLLLADPAVLESALSAPGDENLAELDALEGAGKVWRMRTGADGSYLMHAHVDEPPPESILAAAQAPVVIEAFPIPSGRLAFGGEEYAAELGSLPPTLAHMVSFAELPAGTYRATFWRIEIPESQLSQEERRRISAGDRFQERLGSLGCLAMALCPIGTVAALILTPIGAWPQVLPWVWGILLIAALAGACLYGLLPGLKRAQAIRREVRLEGPSIVARLDRLVPQCEARDGD